MCRLVFGLLLLVACGTPLARTSRTASATEALTESPTANGVIENAAIMR